jgi:hypothetical protein
MLIRHGKMNVYMQMAAFLSFAQRYALIAAYSFSALSARAFKTLFLILGAVVPMPTIKLFQG